MIKHSFIGHTGGLGLVDLLEALEIRMWLLSLTKLLDFLFTHVGSTGEVLLHMSSVIGWWYDDILVQ